MGVGVGVGVWGEGGGGDWVGGCVFKACGFSVVLFKFSEVVLCECLQERKMKNSKKKAAPETVPRRTIALSLKRLRRRTDMLSRLV